jgi:ribosomal protein L11 methylase PrmA
MGLLGTAIRATVVRPGRAWRVPLGIARGLRLRVDPKAPLHTYLGTAELELSPYIKRFAAPGSRCLEVGGHDGGDAMVLARLSGTEVVSFEFDPVCVERMQRNLALNPVLAPRVKIIQTYVAHEQREHPKTDTLDHLIASAVVVEPDFVKMDVEGAEATVLSGARTLLEDRRPHLIIETHSIELEQQCCDLLRERGYTPEIVDQRKWLREKRGERHNRWIVAQGRPSRAAL